MDKVQFKARVYPPPLAGDAPPVVEADPPAADGSGGRVVLAVAFIVVVGALVVTGIDTAPRPIAAVNVALGVAGCAAWCGAALVRLRARGE